MTGSRTTVKAAIDALAAKQGQIRSITPVTLAEQRLQVMLDNTTIFRGIWQPDTLYQANDEVTELGYLGSANKDTYDHLAPVASGDPFSEFGGDDSVPFVTTLAANKKNAVLTQRYDGTDFIGTINELGFFVPTDDPNIFYDFYYQSDSGEAKLISGGLNFTSVGWKLIQSGTAIVISEAFNLVAVVTNRDQTGSVSTSEIYNYRRGNGDPVNGEIVHQANNAEMRISYLNDSGVDIGSALRELTVGDTVAAGGIKWAIQEVVSQVGFLTILVSPEVRLNSGIYLVDFTKFLPQTVPYPLLTNHYQGGVVTGSVTFDGEAATVFNNDSVGFDLLVQSLIFSPDWDIKSAPTGAHTNAATVQPNYLAWRRETQSFNIEKAYKWVDFFPSANNQIIKLPDIDLLAEQDGRIDIYNQSKEPYDVIIHDAQDNFLAKIPPVKSLSFYFNENVPAWEEVQTSGDARPALDPAIYGNFNAPEWADVPDSEYVMFPLGSQVSQFDPAASLNVASKYVFLIKHEFKDGATIADGLHTQDVYIASTDSDFSNVGFHSIRSGFDATNGQVLGWKRQDNTLLAQQQQDLAQAVATANDDIEKLIYCFTAFSLDTVGSTISTDKNNASILTNLQLTPASNGFQVEPTIGAIRNVTGLDIVESCGELALQLFKSGGGTTMLNTYSETSVDNGVTWTLNVGSLRRNEVSATTEGFFSLPSSTGAWPNNTGLVRFRLYTTGTGTLSIRAATDTINGNAIQGRASYWKLKAKF